MSSVRCHPATLSPARVPRAQGREPPRLPLALAPLTISHVEFPDELFIVSTHINIKPLIHARQRVRGCVYSGEQGHPVPCSRCSRITNPHSTRLCTHLETPHRPRPEAQNEHRRECLSPAASSQGRPREHRIPCPRRGSSGAVFLTHPNPRDQLQMCSRLPTSSSLSLSPALFPGITLKLFLTIPILDHLELGLGIQACVPTGQIKQQ